MTPDRTIAEEPTCPSRHAPADDLVRSVTEGYAFDGPALDLGRAGPGRRRVGRDVQVRIPLSVLNRHGLVAGATGTGKTKTLQLMAEQLSAQGVPVFVADVKGDLSGLAVPGEASDADHRPGQDVGQTWTPTGNPVELFALGGKGTGVPVRATVTSFGPVLLAKVLGLGEVQTSSLGLVFHFADKAGLPLLDLKDLRAVIQYLTSDEGKGDLAGLGGLSKATAGVILRELIAFADAGADEFFGEPELDTADLLRTTPDGRGVISCLELPSVQSQPVLFSTFLMWLLADLFETLPEVGDVDKPKLVFFFDEAHLLFDDASDDFLDQVAQTVRLIRSKGVGVFFVTQSPTDVPREVLAQLGSRVQHALRAFTPEDAKALKRTASTYPTSVVRPRGGADLAGHRRGHRHRAVRARGPHPGGVDAAARPAVADGPGARRGAGGDRRGLAAAGRVRPGDRPRQRLRAARRQAGPAAGTRCAGTRAGAAARPSAPSRAPRGPVARPPPSRPPPRRCWARARSSRSPGRRARSSGARSCAPSSG